MHKATWTRIPSEHTIETLCSHYLLHHLNRSRAWLFCPTTNEEKLRGFDSSAQNTRLLILQYKALKYAGVNQLTVDLYDQQIKRLRRNFPKLSFPYLFLVFSIYRSYQELDAGYKSSAAPEFFGNCIFVDLHSISQTCRSLAWKHKEKVIVMKNGHAELGSVNFLTGPQLMCRLSDKELGVVEASLADAPHDDDFSKDQSYSESRRPRVKQSIRIFRIQDC